MPWVIAISLAGVVFGAVVTYIVGFDPLFEEPATATAQGVERTTVSNGAVVEANGESYIEKEVISTPVAGQTLPLSEVKDEAFASGAMGKGIAIEPTEGKVVAPVNAEVSALFPTKHAIGLKTNEGVEILIHVGMDTVQLDGQGFEAKVKAGDKVEAGQVLIEFDMEVIKEAGYSTVTPVIVTNASDYLDVLTTEEPTVSVKDYLMTVVI
jgi:PTS system beta-glucosides-specific IIC component